MNYIDPMRRRFQPQTDSQPIEQPEPMYAQPSAPGPQMPMQMVPLGDQSQQQDQMSQGLGAIGSSLLKRFKKPAGASAGDAKSAFEAGGSL